MTRRRWSPAVAIATAAIAFEAAAQMPAPGDPEATLSRAYPGTAYSPYAQRRFPSLPLWGDTHLHTGLSMDAGLFGARLGLEEAYRFARGEEVVSSTGQPVKLARPLDWLVIADHSDGMGFFDDLVEGAPGILAFDDGKRWYEGLKAGGQASVDAALDLITTFSQGKIPPDLLGQYSPGSKIYASVWEKVVATAEAYNDPGTFTALIGFEWTSLVDGNNLHRNVIFRDGADKAGQVVPFTTQAPIGSTDPLDLYEWLENYEATTGGSALALAHNGNLSNGLMFPVDAQYTGRALDAFYVEQRAKWEPMYEATQIKGDGETHPLLSPDDAFADYETWDAGNLDMSEAKTPEMLPHEYAREALKNGLLLEERLGTNPYKFGMVGSTDSHTALTTAEEDNFFGKHAGAEPSPERMLHPFTKTDKGVIEGWQSVASGRAAVWATENTREAIFDAMARKEVYATTGPRMFVRFFGGWDFTEDDLNSRQPAFRGYEKGVPMGGDLMPNEGAGAPTFMVYALRDPIGASLDRIQIVKGWLDENGETREQVYDVAWSGDREPEANGALPAVGNTVDIAAANWTNTIGASELGLDRPGLRPRSAGLLLRPGDRNPDPALDRLRRVPLRGRDSRGRRDDPPGARLHLAHLVHAGRLRQPMVRMRKILREPLLHFVVLGAGLFVLFGLVGEPGEERPDQIVVSAAKVENLAELFRRTWRRPPTQAEIDGLIEDHIKEEILYREALALGLEQDDIVIRRRLRQKMEFVSEDLAAQAEPSEAELQAFLAEHPERFREPSRVSFSQVYLSRDRRGDDAWRDAERMLMALDAGRSDPAASGDPFLLEQDYRNVTAQDVERLFGGGFAERVAELPVGRWSGPVESGYGLHLVLVRERTPARGPELDEVRGTIANEWRAARREEANRTFYEGLRARYEVSVERPAWVAERPAAVAERQ